MDHYIMMTTSVVYLYNMLIPEIHDFELWIKTNFQFMIVVGFSTVASKFRPERDSNRIPRDAGAVLNQMSYNAKRQ